MRRWLALAFGLAAATACARSGPPSPQAEQYLDRALQLIRQHHIDSSTADWPTLERSAHREIAGAKTTRDTYAAIAGVLDALGEKHSFFEPPKPALPASALVARSAEAPPMPSGQVIHGHYGLVALPELVTVGKGRDALGPIYTKMLKSLLLQMDRRPLCGWIVDLREDGGGNMWPMLQGLDSLLGNPPFGYFVTAGEPNVPWILSNKAVTSLPATAPKAAPAYSLKHQDAPVAVLIGPHTGSSGEMIAIAFIGRSGARTFGTPSAGYTTANIPYPMSDGAFLVITTSRVRDRTGKDYHGPIAPDVTTQDAEADAVRWLSSQCPEATDAAAI